MEADILNDSFQVVTLHDVSGRGEYTAIYRKQLAVEALKTAKAAQELETSPRGQLHNTTQLGKFPGLYKTQTFNIKN